MTKKINYITTIIAIIAVVALVSWIVIPRIQGTTTVPKVETIEDQKSRIRLFLSNAGSFFIDLVILEEHTDANGEPYCVGVLVPKLDMVLPDLVDAYNADPSTTKHATEEEIRFWLTDGIAEATASGTEGKELHSFLKWLSKTAELVRRDNPEELVKHFHSNYDFILARDGTLKDYKFSWE